MLIGSVLRLLAWAFSWPIGLVFLSELSIVISLTWIACYDVLPHFFGFFFWLNKHFRKKDSFLFVLLIVSVILRSVAHFLPSGDTKSEFNTVSFYSFTGAILWFIGANLYQYIIPSIKFLRPKPPHPDHGLTTEGIITAIALVSLPPVAALLFLAPAGLASYQFSVGDFMIMTYLLQAAIIIYIFNWLIRPKIMTWQDLGVRPVNRDRATEAFWLFLLVAVGIAIIEMIAQRLGLPINQYAFTSKNDMYYAFIPAVIIGPFFEELFFRGFLFKAMKHYSLFAAYAVSAGFFALLHPPLALMFESLIIGILLAYLLQRTKSIWPGVIIHAVNNAIVLGFLLLK